MGTRRMLLMQIERSRRHLVVSINSAVSALNNNPYTLLFFFQFFAIPIPVCSEAAFENCFSCGDIDAETETAECETCNTGYVLEDMSPQGPCIGIIFILILIIFNSSCYW